jgi:hypothetical protein
MEMFLCRVRDFVNSATLAGLTGLAAIDGAPPGSTARSDDSGRPGLASSARGIV